MPFSSTFLLSKTIANCNKLRLLSLQSAKRFSTPSAIVKRNNGPSKPVNVDILGTWDSRTELPLELESSINYGKPIPQIRISSVGTHTIQGRRPYNEDRFVVKELKPHLLYFAVFDGHGGSECADYCYTHMEDHLTFWIERLTLSDLEHAIDAAFLEVNNSFARWWAYHGKGRPVQLLFIIMNVINFSFLSWQLPATFQEQQQPFLSFTTIWTSTLATWWAIIDFIDYSQFVYIFPYTFRGTAELWFVVTEKPGASHQTTVRPSWRKRWTIP